MSTHSAAPLSGISGRGYIDEGNASNLPQPEVFRSIAAGWSGTDETANLQLTVKKIAAIVGISERLIYMGIRLLRMRPDLADRVGAGEMTLNKALSIAEQKPKKTSYDRLLAAWNSATDEDRERLIAVSA